MKKRLVELLCESGASFERALPEEIASNLLANDVIVQAHGHWIDGITLEKCSLCGKKGFPDWRYCPNCGAKMDGLAEREGEG
jgi:hypothetical protein